MTAAVQMLSETACLLLADGGLDDLYCMALSVGLRVRYG